jgi:hypothetical protein
MEMEATARDPENSGWYKTILNTLVSVLMLQNIFIATFNTSNKNQQHKVVPVLPNGHSSRRS